MNMNYSRITSMILMSLMLHLSVVAEVPLAEIRLAKPNVVVGEPIVVDIVLRNTSQTEICSLHPLEIEKGLVGPVLQVFKNGDLVARWYSNTGCLAGVGKIKTMFGNCLDVLQPNEQMRGRALVVFMAVDSEDASQRIPLGEGRYTVTGSIQWDGIRLETKPVLLEIIAPRFRDEVLVSESVDHTFASFMGDLHMRMGMHRMQPTHAVKRILEECPNSVHARLARSRLLVLQAHKLKSRRGTTDEEREADKQLMIDVVSRIDAHLRTNDDDPLELDLMDGKIHLLRRLERGDKLRQAIDALAAKYPHSGRTRRAQKMWKQIHSNPNDRE